MSVTSAIIQPAPTDPSQNQDHPFHYQNALPHLPDTARTIPRLFVDPRRQDFRPYLSGQRESMRYLVNDGAPPENIIGADSEGRFIELGYELFQDKETLKSQLYTASIFDDDFLVEWHEKVDVIYAGAFLHLFDFEKQLKIMAQLVKLLRKKPGSLVFGRNL
ncbi:hypothetical protein N7488_000292 [Penicillium malachiteum]|nr:hypothetical protein N7488_000292 [Penicillium malachiteum]